MTELTWSSCSSIVRSRFLPETLKYFELFLHSLQSKPRYLLHGFKHFVWNVKPSYFHKSYCIKLGYLSFQMHRRQTFMAISCCLNILQSHLYHAATLASLKSGRLKEVGCLIEVQYKLCRKSSKHDFIDSTQQNAFKK